MATTAASHSSSSSSSEPQEPTAEDEALTRGRALRINIRPQSRLWLQNFPDVTEHTSPRQLEDDDDIDNSNNDYISIIPPATPVITPVSTTPSTVRSPIVLPLKVKNALTTADANLSSAPPPMTADMRRRSSNGVNFNRTQYSTLSGQLWRRASGDITSVVGVVTTPLANVENAEHSKDKEVAVVRKVTFNVPDTSSSSTTTTTTTNDNEEGKVRRVSVQLAQTQAGALRRISMFPHHYRRNPSSSNEQSNENEEEEGEEEGEVGEVIKIDGRTILTLNGARLPSIGATADSNRRDSNESVGKRGSFLVEGEERINNDDASKEHTDELRFSGGNKNDVEQPQADLFVIGDGEEDNETIFENISLYTDDSAEVVEVEQVENVNTSIPREEDDEDIEEQDTLEELEELDHITDEVGTSTINLATTKKIPRPLSEIVFTKLRNDSSSSIGDESLSDTQAISSAVDPPNTDDDSISTNPVTVRSSRAIHLHRNSEILKQTIPEEPTTPEKSIHEQHLIAFAPSLGTAAASHKRLSKLHDVSNIVKSSEVFAEDSVYLHDIRHRSSTTTTNSNNNSEDDDLPPYLRQYALGNKAPAAAAVITTHNHENNNSSKRASSGIGIQDVALMPLPSEKAAAEASSQAQQEHANTTSRASISSTATSKRSSWYCSLPSIRSSIASSNGYVTDNSSTSSSSNKHNSSSGGRSSNRWSAASSSNVSPRTSYTPTTTTTNTGSKKKKHTTRASVYIAGKPVFSSAYRDHHEDYVCNDEDEEGEEGYVIYDEKEVDGDEGQEEIRPSEREIKLQRENDYLRNRVLELEKHLDVALKHALNARRDDSDDDDA